MVHSQQTSLPKLSHFHRDTHLQRKKKVRRQKKACEINNQKNNALLLRDEHRPPPPWIQNVDNPEQKWEQGEGKGYQKHGGASSLKRRRREIRENRKSYFIGCCLQMVLMDRCNILFPFLDCNSYWTRLVSDFDIGPFFISIWYYQ